MNVKINEKDLNDESLLYKPENLITVNKGTLLNEIWNLKDKEIVTEKLFTDDKLKFSETKIKFDDETTEIEKNEDVSMDNDKILEKYLDTVESERKDSEVRIATNISDFRKALLDDRKESEERLSKQIADNDVKMDAKLNKLNEKMDTKLDETKDFVQATLKDMDAKFDRMIDKIDAKFDRVNDKIDAKIDKVNDSWDAKLKETSDLLQATIKSIDVKLEETSDLLQATIKETDIKVNKITDKITETSITTIRWVVALVAAAMISMFGISITFVLKIWNP
ncbi:MAG: cytochrome P450 [Oscillospiraceae bacterium]|nr:cytochrome P450 [Oscillospiraceae bacterium]